MANNLIRVRSRLGVTVYGLVARAHVSAATINMIEHHDYLPGEAVRRKLAAALGITQGDIWPESMGETTEEKQGGSNELV